MNLLPSGLPRLVTLCFCSLLASRAVAQDSTTAVSVSLALPDSVPYGDFVYATIEITNVTMDTVYPFGGRQSLFTSLTNRDSVGGTTEVHVSPWQREIGVPPTTSLSLRVNLTEQVYDSTLLEATQVRAYYFAGDDQRGVQATGAALLVWQTDSDSSGLDAFLRADRYHFNTDQFGLTYAERYEKFIEQHPRSPFVQIARDRMIELYWEEREVERLRSALKANLREPRISSERAEYYEGWYTALTLGD